MKAIKLLAETDQTVTLSRQDFDMLLDEAELRDDAALIVQRQRLEETLGIERSRRDYLTAADLQRLLDGESAVRVWRERRGMGQHDLATAIGTSQRQLAEIEAGHNPADGGLYERIAAALDVSLDLVSPRDQ